MRLLAKTKDGGPKSPVEAYFLFELKSIGSIALLKFNKGGREEFHTHAFNALTWFICGNLKEEMYKGNKKRYRRSIFPKITLRNHNHRVIADKTSWCLTMRGPWKNTWTEDSNDSTTIFTHGRQVLNVINKI